MITIKEISEKANVSTTTVSNVINGKTGHVSKAVIEKIEFLLREYHYVSPMGLRVLSKANSKIVGMVSFNDKRFDDTIYADPFYGAIVGIVEQKLREAGYYMMLYSASDINDIFQLTQAWNVDGIIAVTFNACECEKFRLMTDKPLVTIDLNGTPPKSVVNIGLDDFGGAYRMTRYLISCGYHNIYTLDLRLECTRYLGYVQALKDCNIKVKKENRIILSDQKTKRMEQYESFIQSLQKNDALFFFNDKHAIEAISVFIDHHIAIPDDIAIVGFDDLVQSSMCHPKLTTVHQSFKRKAELAVNYMIQLLNNKPIEQYNIALPTEIIVRQSTKILYT